MIRDHRRALFRQTVIVQFRRERLELDGGPTAEESLALTTIERRLESETFRLNAYGVIVLNGREVQLGRHDLALSEKYRLEDDWEDQMRRYRLIEMYARRWNVEITGRDKHRHQRTSEAKQQTDSRTIEVASASAGAGAAPSAGEAAAHGAGEAASAGSQSRSRSRSSSSSIAARAIGQWPRSQRHRSRSTPQTVRARVQQ